MQLLARHQDLRGNELEISGQVLRHEVVIERVRLVRPGAALDGAPDTEAEALAALDADDWAAIEQDLVDAATD